MLRCAKFLANVSFRIPFSLQSIHYIRQTMPYLSFLVSFVLKMSNLLCVDAELVYPLSWVHTEKIFPAQLLLKTT